MLRLPLPIPSNPIIQPVALPTDCGAYLWTDDEYVQVVGNGLTSFDGSNNVDRRLRHAFLHTIPNKQCVELTPQSEPGSVICSLPTNGQSTFQGDSGILDLLLFSSLFRSSTMIHRCPIICCLLIGVIFSLSLSGGPVLRQSDGVLIGHISSGRIETKGFFFKKHNIVYQVFTNFHYHFDWIASVTGLNLPRCGHPTIDLADLAST